MDRRRPFDGSGNGCRNCQRHVLHVLARFHGREPFLIPHEQLAGRHGHGSTLARLGYVRGRVHAAGDTVRISFLAALEQLGAGAYVECRSQEMRASGVPACAAGALQGPAALAGLTEQEKAAADLVAAGFSNKEAAAELYVSVKTVQYHLTLIYAKFHVTSRSGLAAVYRGHLEQAAEGGWEGGNQALPQ